MAAEPAYSFKKLMGLPAQARRDLVELAPEYQDWALCVRVCEVSSKAASDDPEVALAELAVFVARRVPGTEAWRARLEGYSLGFLANAQGGEPPGRGRRGLPAALAPLGGGRG